jgi:tetratricopeptide (TPR) repeat protein
MARYDRIERLPCPERDAAFPGWLSLRDLEGRERQPELGRRARLRYLALRPVRRLLQRGLADLDASSFEQQVRDVRTEVDRLPSADPERRRLTAYLKEVGGRTPEGMVRATLDVGAAAEAARHMYAAEEFYLVGLEVAEAHGLEDARIEALQRLGRVYRDREEFDRGRQRLREAIQLAERTGGLPWARAMDGMAALERRAGEEERARSLLAELGRRADVEGNGRMTAAAAAGRCALELSAGDPEAALAEGWQAIQLLPPEDEARNAALLDMAAAFRRLGLHSAADSCYLIVGQWAAWPEHRIEARIERALVAAEADRPEEFRERRAAVVQSVSGADPYLRVMADLALGRGAMLIGDTDDAREHLRAAIASARDNAFEDTLPRAEELLQALEEESGVADRGIGTSPSSQSRTIAQRVQALERARA